MGDRRMARMILAFVLVWLVALPAYAVDLTLPNTFTNGTVADADEVNANFTELETAIEYDDTYYCEAYSGGDIGAKCNAAYAAMVTSGRGGTLVTPIGSSTQTTPIDFCDETGLGDWVPVRFVLGAAGSLSDFAHTRLIAGSGIASSNVSKTTYAITTAVDASNRDQITCVGCDFRAGVNGVRRNDLIELSNFANASNNHNRTVGKVPLRVYRATATTLIVEGETATDPGLVTQSASATGDIRKLVSQIETCHFGQYVIGGNIDGDSSNLYADIGIHHHPDDDPNAECSASTTPYSYCSGADAGTVPSNVICVNCGVEGSIVEFHRYGNIVAGALEVSGQSDNYTIERVTTSDAPIGVWWDLLQGKPGLSLRDSQITNFYRNGIRQSSGGLNMESLTVISGRSDCNSDTFGTCNYIEVLTNNTTQTALSHSEVEITAGDGLVVGSLTSSERSLSLIGNTFYANDSDSSAMKMVDVPGFCGAIQNSANLYRTGNTNAVAPTITFGNSNQASCPSIIAGKSDYRAAGGEVAPTLTINNSIPASLSGVESSPATGATLVYNGTTWVDGQLDLADADAVTGVLPEANADAALARTSALSAYTTGTSTPVDGSTACNTGDMHLETDAFKIYFCTDGSTDKWYGVALSDTP